jgi:DnaJ-class molecular chaperone
MTTTTKTKTCPECYGTRQKAEMRAVRFGQSLPPYKPCPRCEGTGEIPDPEPERTR